MALFGISSLRLYVYDNYTQPIVYEFGREIRKKRNTNPKCNLDTFMTSLWRHFCQFFKFSRYFTRKVKCEPEDLPWNNINGNLSRTKFLRESEKNVKCLKNSMFTILWPHYDEILNVLCNFTIKNRKIFNSNRMEMANTSF